MNEKADNCHPCLNINVIRNDHDHEKYSSAEMLKKLIQLILNLMICEMERN